MYWSRFGVFPPVRSFCGFGARLFQFSAAGFFLRIGHDGEKIFSQRLSVDLLEFLADIAHHPRQFIVAGKGEHGEASTNLACVVLDRAQGPRFGQHL